MTREEAAKNPVDLAIWEFENAIKVTEEDNSEYPNYCIHIDEYKTALKALLWMKGPQPDPITGLVPCGCGTPMLLMGDDETQYWVECGDSVNCPHFIGQAYDGAGIYQTPEEAIKAARVAMGWKGGAE